MGLMINYTNITELRKAAVAPIVADYRNPTIPDEYKLLNQLDLVAKNCLLRDDGSTRVKVNHVLDLLAHHGGVTIYISEGLVVHDTVTANNTNELILAISRRLMELVNDWGGGNISKFCLQHKLNYVTMKAVSRNIRAGENGTTLQTSLMAVLELARKVPQPWKLVIKAT